MFTVQGCLYITLSFYSQSVMGINKFGTVLLLKCKHLFLTDGLNQFMFQCKELETSVSPFLTF